MNEEPIFPYDIFSVIVYHFVSHPENTQDLITIGYVCSDFAQLRRPHLFRQVKLDMEGLPEHQTRLVNLVQSNPEISNYIRHVGHRRSSLFIPQLPDVGFPLTMKRSQRPGAFLKFPNVAELTILGNKLVPYVMEEVPRFNYRRMLDHFMAKRCLTHLCLEGVTDLPIFLILSQPKLLHLTLIACTVSPWHNNPPSTESLSSGFNLKSFTAAVSLDHAVPPALLYCRQLEYLDTSRLTCVNPLTAPIHLPIRNPPPAIFRNVERITASVHTEWKSFCYVADREGLKAFPGAKRVTISPWTTGPHRYIVVQVTLRYIRGSEVLQLSGRSSPSYFFTVLQPCFDDSASSLQSIQIYYEEHRFNAVFLTHLCDALIAMRKDNALSNIVINWHITSPDHTIASPNSRFADEWRTLDWILVGDRSDFPALEMVEVCLWTPLSAQRSKMPWSWAGKWTGCMKSEYRCLLDEPLKGLISADGLQVCCTVYPL
ncbi:hypothetical protein BJ165DRAFT_1490171 [Panaeolus papilionaceus]|nr:hypothetical protein BJ165DRAFT_1490171 [Panaeolus papilionaceus]